jgi:hypothetical protein
MADPEWTIVLFATCGLGDFVENALLSIQHCGIDLALVQLVFPLNAESELLSLAGRFGVRPRRLEELVDTGADAMPTAYLDYGTPEFNRLMRLKFPVLRALLQEGRSVVYADVDVAWIRNPLPYLARVLEIYPWACQTEPFPAFPPDFCLGFFALRPDPRCIELIELHMARFMASDQPACTTQALFRQLMREQPKHLTHIFPLPEGLFPAGLLYATVQPRPDEAVALAGALLPFIFHGNWTIGQENKRQLLKAAGAWLSPSDI